MAIYHFEAKAVSRGAGRSAAAAAAYMSCSKILNDYDGVLHDYTRKQGLVWQRVFLPRHAPEEWRNRSALWNAVEENEKTKDSRLAREFVAALPAELNKSEWQGLLDGFIREHFVADGMCADAAIHDPHPPGHNPHAHIMVTVRPLDGQGNWQHKTEKEYLCIRNGEERGFTAAEFQAAQADGWEKQYQYKSGRKKVYMAPSAAKAQGLERISKHPKSTKYGRQNPITEHWNSEGQLVAWRRAWADAANRSLEQHGHDASIDHRSHADRGLDEQPTVHEGIVARGLEKQGIISDRCEMNRRIKADNALLRELKETVKKLMQAANNTIPAVAEAMEKLRENIILIRYQLNYLAASRHSMGEHVRAVRPELDRCDGLERQLREKTKERKCLLAEKKETPFYQPVKLHDLSVRIAGLTEELEELKSEREKLLHMLGCADDAGVSDRKKDLAAKEAALKKLDEQEVKYAAGLDNALKRYADLKEQAAGMDAGELTEARAALRPDRERSAVSRAQAAYGRKYDPQIMRDSRRDIAGLLNEEAETQSVRERLRRHQKEQNQQKQQQKSKHKWQER